MIVDFHTHTFPDPIAAATIAKLSGLSHTRVFTDATAASLTASMARAGIDLSVVLPVATNPRQVYKINEAAARLGETPGLLSFGCIHPDCEDAGAVLAQVAVLGLKGVKIHPFYQGVDLDDPRYLRILERAGALGLTVVTHAGLDLGYPGVVRCSPRMALRALRQVGPVKLVLAHMGGWRSWDEAEELLVSTSAYLDTSFSTGSLTPLEDGYFAPEELSLLDGARFMGMVRAFGAGRILFGTDSPWTDQRASLDWLRALPLTRAEQTAILGGNARTLLGV